jgi:hypothetical protein
VITIRIPGPSSVLAVNLLGTLGLVAVVLAVGGLAGAWWAVLAAGVALLGLSVIASTHLARQEAPVTRPVAVAKSS